MGLGITRGPRAGGLAPLAAVVLLLPGIGGPQAVRRESAPAAAPDADGDEREEAILALRGRSGEAELMLLGQALLDVEVRVRRAAVERLAGIGGDRAVAVLAFALGDPEAAVRADVVYALARIRSAAAISVLDRALGDREASVREAAAEILEEIARAPPSPVREPG